MRVFSHMRLFNDFFDKSKGKKRTWANPIGSKQWKFQHKVDNLTFLFTLAFFDF